VKTINTELVESERDLAGRCYDPVLDYSSTGSTSVFSVISCLQVGHRAGYVRV
jgi:hypothetical protein